MVAALARRHLRLFFRDRMAIFFAILSPLIMLALYSFFLGTVQVEDLTDAFPAADPDAVSDFITSWVFAGIVMITTLTTGLAALNIFVEDHASGRFKDFAVSPISKRQLIFGYLLSTFLIALAISTVVFLMSQIYIKAVGGPVLSIENMAVAYAYIVISCAGFAAMSSFFVTFIKSTAAYTSVSVIVGSVVGFLAGIYIQPGTLGSGVVAAINTLPFAQAATLIRQPFTEQSLATLTHGNAASASTLVEHYGIGTIRVAGQNLEPMSIVLLFIFFSIVFVFLGAWRLTKKIA